MAGNHPPPPLSSGADTSSEGTAQPYLWGGLAVAALGLGGAVYFRDALFGSSALPRGDRPRNDDLLNEVAKDYKDLEISERRKPGSGAMRYVCKFHNTLTVSYDTEQAAFSIGEIERPRGAKYHASDILEYAFRRIEERADKRLPLRVIEGAGIVNKATAAFANLPGVRQLSNLVSGRLSVDVGRRLPLGKMIEHFLADYHPDLFMTSITLQPGPRPTAQNTVVTLGPRP